MAEVSTTINDARVPSAETDRFLRHNGELTRYALACGYLECYPNVKPSDPAFDPENHLTFGYESQCYEIKGRIAGERILEHYGRYSAARQVFRRLCRQLDAARNAD